MTAPPRALPCSWVTMIPVGAAPASPKSRPCWMAFCPTAITVEDQERLVRRAGQPATHHPDDLAQLLHEALLGVQASGGCRRCTVSKPRDTAASAASKATAAGSAARHPSERTGYPVAQPRPAAARSRRPGRVSAAAEHHPGDLPAAAGTRLGRGVGLPVPLTPTIRMTVGPSGFSASAHPVGRRRAWPPDGLPSARRRWPSVLTCPAGPRPPAPG